MTFVSISSGIFKIICKNLPENATPLSSSQLLLLACLLGWLLSSKINENLLLRFFLRKLNWYISGIWFMILSKDNKKIGVKYCVDSDSIKLLQNKSKRIIFIRHGESDWNSVFNKGFNLLFVPRLLYAILREWSLFLSLDSVFIDSPLNEEGFEQAVKLQEFIANGSTKDSKVNVATNIASTLEVLRGEGTQTSVIVSSNLRRAISTTTVALWQRLEKTGESMLILSSLQEISRNIDTQALSYANTTPDLSRLSRHIQTNTRAFDPAKVYDTTGHTGSKTLSYTGAKRLRSFNEWAFQRPEDVIIVGGHSLWFKYFFQMHLPKGSDHEAKRMKIANSGVVAFTLWRADGTDGLPISVGGEIVYRIDPESIVTAYGGFTSK